MENYIILRREGEKGVIIWFIYNVKKKKKEKKKYNIGRERERGEKKCSLYRKNDFIIFFF